MCDLPWQPPVWDRVSNQKHRKSNTRHWERSITTAITGQRGETAQFSPEVTDAQLAEIEIAIASGAEGTQIQDKCHKRTFYRDMGRVIGASSGEQTTFIFVEYVNSGAVHGRPMTWEEIQEKLKRAAR